MTVTPSPDATTTDRTDTPLTGKVAIVTGGSRGIGAAVVRRLARHGAAVAFTYRHSADAAEKLAAEIAEAGGRAIPIQADSTDTEATVAVVERTVAELGGLDIVVANSAVFGGGPLSDVSLDVYDDIMTANVRSVFVLAQAAARHLREGGRVVVIGSVNGDITIAPGVTIYATSKAAVAGMVRGLARDLADRAITVNVVQPGPIDTDMNPADGPMSSLLTPRTALQRYGRADEVASLVGYLASPEAGYVTGATLDIDGGLKI